MWTSQACCSHPSLHSTFRVWALGPRSCLGSTVNQCSCLGGFSPFMSLFLTSNVGLTFGGSQLSELLTKAQPKALVKVISPEKHSQPCHTLDCPISLLVWCHPCGRRDHCAPVAVLLPLFSPHLFLNFS